MAIREGWPRPGVVMRGVVELRRKEGETMRREGWRGEWGECWWVVAWAPMVLPNAVASGTIGEAGWQMRGRGARRRGSGKGEGRWQQVAMWTLRQCADR
jgi:hypothetical protein